MIKNGKVQESDTMKEKLAFVIPWYGENISGGAEQELRDLVHHLIDAEVALEVLTTCVESFGSNWNTDYHRPGVSVENGVPVRRFRVRKRSTKQFDRVNAKCMAGEHLTKEEEIVFLREMVNSPDLYDYIRNHREEYSLFYFIPYMFGTTYYGAQICPEKTILIPCLHDESYAYFSAFRDAYSHVKGMIFNSFPEQSLAEKLFDVKGDTFQTLGIGVSNAPSADGERFREKYSIADPFILYAGRKEAGKRVDVLVRYFLLHKKEYPSDLKLLLIGGGRIDTFHSPDIIDLGFVSMEDKYDAYAAASIFCNPSEFESFSLVIMESWLAKTPVLVNEACAVTKDFAVRANAGLYYSNASEFSACVSYLLEHPDIRKTMGENGCHFVKSNFTWDVVIQKHLDYISLASS